MRVLPNELYGIHSDLYYETRVVMIWACIYVCPYGVRYDVMRYTYDTVLNCIMWVYYDTRVTLSVAHMTCFDFSVQ